MLKPVILLSPGGGGKGERGGKVIWEITWFSGRERRGISRRQKSIRERQGEIIRI